MGRVTVQLDGWEHECCGDRRRVGDTVTLSVAYHDGHWFEQRHDYGNGMSQRRVSGRLVAIGWRPAILRHVTDVAQEVEGYGPAVLLQSTEERPAGDCWAFDFEVETDGLPPEAGR